MGSQGVTMENTTCSSARRTLCCPIPCPTSANPVLDAPIRRVWRTRHPALYFVIMIGTGGFPKSLSLHGINGTKKQKWRPVGRKRRSFLASCFRSSKALRGTYQKIPYESLFLDQLPVPILVAAFRDTHRGAQGGHNWGICKHFVLALSGTKLFPRQKFVCFFVRSPLLPLSTVLFFSIKPKRLRAFIQGGGFIIRISCPAPPRFSGQAQGIR